MKAKLINFQDEHGETALHIGARMGHKKVVECFLFAGADVNLK
jgi:ankyrin repeat protein